MSSNVKISLYVKISLSILPLETNLGLFGPHGVAPVEEVRLSSSLAVQPIAALQKWMLHQQPSS